ncbi:outer membrane beta-barrel protein [Devosia sp.]|uniref:outer membrane beta-barrel protein n=1 Tax=Devosia sp. TaxID=1871048 RepID=UPI003A920C37
MRQHKPVRKAARAIALTALGGFSPAVFAAGEGSFTDNPALLSGPPVPCASCAHLPSEPVDPWLDLDWSIALRGAVTEESGKTRKELQIVPEASLTHQSLRGGYEIGGDAELAITDAGNARISTLNFTAEGTHALDAVTDITGSAELSLSQEDPNAPDQPANLKSTPLVVEASAEAGVTRTIGLAEIGLRGSLGRAMTGETVFDDNSTEDNSYLDRTQVGIGGRFGWRLAPFATVWIDGEASYEFYDKLSPSLMVKLDNWTYSGKLGATAQLRNTTELEAAVGVSWRDYDDPTLDDFYAMLYEASISHKPDETVTLTAGLTTTLSSPQSGSSATARLTYAATTTAQIAVNPWLTARSSAGASLTKPMGAGTEEQSWNVGAGLDWLVNPNTDITADYRFTQTLSEPDPPEESHQLTLGVTFHR